MKIMYENCGRQGKFHPMSTSKPILCGYEHSCQLSFSDMKITLKDIVQICSEKEVCECIQQLFHMKFLLC